MGNDKVSASQNELLGVIIFATICTFIMGFLGAFERLHIFINGFDFFQFGEFAVFFPAFTALGFTYFSYRRIRDLEFEITKRKDAEEALRGSERKYKELSITDELTQLHNSRHFHDSLTVEIERAVRYNRPLSILLLDIDNFKNYNDRYGHLAGNKVLVILGQVILKNIRPADPAFRYGGEEFTVILPETKVEGALMVAERIREKFEAEALSPEPNEIIHNTVSIGIAQYKPKEDVDSLTHRADTAMYAAKRQGKNRVIISPHDHSE
jgi:diguanylate cyclase (GGDEF)-like protein